MTTIFDGKNYALGKEKEIKSQVANLNKKGIKPKLATILVGDNPASRLYVSLKQKAGERVGIEVEVYKVNKIKTAIHILHLIKLLNDDPKIHGIMVQLPLPEKFKKDQAKIINQIAPHKDVDGMQENSTYLPATVKAVMTVLKEAKLTGNNKKILVIGAKGEVGRRLVLALKTKWWKIEEADIDTKNLTTLAQRVKCIISCTGQEGLIKANMVGENSVVIDVGAPKGDVDFNEVSKKARFITPVPGGVGPVTIVSLLENLVEAAYNTHK